MTLDLTADQPAETMPAETMQAEPARAIETRCTVVTIDGVVVRVAERPDGSLALLPSGNRAPLVFDKWQVLAIKAALTEAA